ncbi:MAG: RNA polymerase sigma factor [Desulfovibrio sp.]
MPQTQDDISVIADILNGNNNAFEQLLIRHEQSVVRIVAAHIPKENVAEVVHETFIKAYKSLANYKPIKPFRNWLGTIATRTCHDYWRVKYRRREAPVCEICKDGQHFLETAMASDSLEEFNKLARRDEARELLGLVLDQLAPLDRMVLTMTYLEGYSIKETAEHLDISTPNVKVRGFRAKKKLKAFLKRYGIQGGMYET